MFDVIIVGAGFAGCVLAERLANVAKKKVLIVEKRQHIGGNCYDEKIEDILVHKYGPHLFHTDDKEVWEYLSQFTEWELYQHKVRASIDGKKVPIPFNFNTLNLLFPQQLAQQLERELLRLYKVGERVPILDLLEANEEKLRFLANYIYEKIFLNYTIKQWGIKPEEIDKGVTARVPVVLSRDDRYFNDRYQAVPKEGYTKLFQRLIDNENIKLMLNTDFFEVARVDSDAKKIYFLNSEFQGTLIYTGMIDKLCDYRFGELPYRSLKLKFMILQQNFFQEVATVNYPNEYDFTRITEFKHIHPKDIDKTVILKEYPQQYQRDKNEPYYPFFTEENRRLYEKYRTFVEKRFKNIVLVGRLAEYRYYDMDDIVKRALNVFKEYIW